MPGVPRAAILRLMLKRSLLALPAIAGAALLATRLVPGSLPDGSTLLPSGWRIRPAGRAVPVGTLPLNLVTLSDGSVMVTNDGYGENSLMRIDPVRAHVVWHVTLPAAWLGLARDRKSTRLNSSHGYISYAVFCLKKKKQPQTPESSHDHPHSDYAIPPHIA